MRIAEIAVLAARGRCIFRLILDCAWLEIRLMLLVIRGMNFCWYSFFLYFSDVSRHASTLRFFSKSRGFIDTFCVLQNVCTIITKKWFEFSLFSRGSRLRAFKKNLSFSTRDHKVITMYNARILEKSSVIERNALNEVGLIARLFDPLRELCRLVLGLKTKREPGFFLYVIEFIHASLAPVFTRWIRGSPLKLSGVFVPRTTNCFKLTRVLSSYYAHR